MSRKAKGARLFERKRKGRDPVFVILDTGGFEKSTGTGCRVEAEKALAEYITQRDARAGVATPPTEMMVGLALEIYAEEHAAEVAAPERQGYSIAALAPFWADKYVSDVTGATCRLYARRRTAAPGTIRRELNTLQAALNHCHREGYLQSAPRVAMPPKPEAKDRWLTKREAYWLLRGCRAVPRDSKHLAWFVLLCLYTGARKSAATNTAISTVPMLKNGYINPETGMLYRKGGEERATKKQRLPAQCPSKLLAHARRKHRLGHKWFVQNSAGLRINDPKKGFVVAKMLAGKLAAAAGEPNIDLSDVTPHTLKHTAVTWAMQSGVDVFKAAGFFSTSHETLIKTYAHHHPDFQSEVANAMDRRAK